MIAPDLILPSQFFIRLQRRPLSAEMRLMAAVLEDAVHCFQVYLLSSDPRERQLFREAEEWITFADRSWLFSFNNVCDFLGIDPHYLRKGLLAWKEANAKKWRDK